MIRPPILKSTSCQFKNVLLVGAPLEHAFTIVSSYLLVVPLNTARTDLKSEFAILIPNTRYADDLLFHATSLVELGQMLAILIEELARVGLEVHDGKNKMITSNIHNSIDDVNISDKLIEILDCDISHTYLG